MLSSVPYGELCAVQIFFAFTVSAHNSVPWLERGKPRPGRPDALILDAPIWHHWPQLLLWIPFQASIFYLLFAWGDSKLPTSRSLTKLVSILDLTGHMICRCWNINSFEGQASSEVPYVYAEGYDGWSKERCNYDILATCRPPWKVTIVTIIWGVLCVCYQIAYILYNAIAHHRLQMLPYGRYRTGHALLVWQVGSPSLHALSDRLPIAWPLSERLHSRAREKVCSGGFECLVMLVQRHSLLMCMPLCGLMKLCLSQRRAGRWVMLFAGGNPALRFFNNADPDCSISLF